MSVIPSVLCIIVIAAVVGILYWRHVSDTQIIRGTEASTSDIIQFTPEFDATKYWRSWLGVLVACAMSILIVHLRFPNTLWRDQVWLGLQVGILPGWLIGGTWHLCSIKPTPKISSKNLLIFLSLLSCLTGIGVFHSIPKLREQEKQVSLIHSLGKDDILQANIVIEPANEITITTPNSLDAFKKLLSDAKLSAASKRMSLKKKLKIEVKTSSGNFTYDAFVVNNQPNDIMLKITTRGKDYVICLPGLKRWLDENILNKKK